MALPAGVKASAGAVACVMGDMDLVRPLALAKIQCAAVARRDDPPAFSRSVFARIERLDAWTEQQAQVDELLRFAAGQGCAPVLFYGGDAELLIVSRHRDALKAAFRFVVPERSMVEDLVQKDRFADLAADLGLPVPASRRLRPASESPPPLRYPILVKPVTRRDATWSLAAGRAKALRVDSARELGALWPRLAATGADALAQELVTGPETRIESYHAYVDPSGRVAGEFTGRKLRTLPPQFGHSTALTTTDAADVTAAGRDVVERLGFTGLLKADFKRRPSGELRLLEVNPRFSLWHHLGAVAGVNLPALVFADLTGTPRPRVRKAIPGRTWISPWQDLQAARAAGVAPFRWLELLVRCPAKSVLAADDPMPFLRGRVMRRLAHGLPALTRGSGPPP
jgi:predicted ATP-grasp superfamily ATP-dependent carboligase